MWGLTQIAGFAVERPGCKFHHDKACRQDRVPSVSVAKLVRYLNDGMLHSAAAGNEPLKLLLYSIKVLNEENAILHQLTQPPLVRWKHGGGSSTNRSAVTLLKESGMDPVSWLEFN